jgi:hypothetical protein
VTGQLRQQEEKPTARRHHRRSYYANGQGEDADGGHRRKLFLFSYNCYNRYDKIWKENDESA